MTTNYNSYVDLPNFKNILLEESYVLDIKIRYRVVKFQLDLVLTQNHKQYTKPPRNEIFCYRRAELIFNDVKAVNWINHGIKAASDNSGEIDFGNIDSLEYEKDKYIAEGDWGNMEIISAIPEIIIK